jgi:hypothetical protein
VRLLRGERLHVRVAALWSNASVGLSVFAKGAGGVTTRHPGRTQRLSYRAPRTGWYDVKLRIERHGGGRYSLQLTKTR